MLKDISNSSGHSRGDLRLEIHAVSIEIIRSMLPEARSGRTDCRETGCRSERTLQRFSSCSRM
jgi:hypothetical protein